MNLTMNTQWSKNDRRTYLIVTVSADDTPEASASQTYLDIQLPEGVRIRHIGNLPSDGHGNNIGVDLPDLPAGEHQNIVFRVKSRLETENEITPELHLHWIDSASGDLLERHQTGTPMPAESTGADERLAGIVAAARSDNPTPRRHHRRHSQKDPNSMTANHHPRHRRHTRHESNQENESMPTEQTPSNRRPHRCGRRHENHEAFMAGREFGRRGRHAARHGRDGMSPRKRAMIMQIREMQDRIDEVEQRIARLQGKTSFRGMRSNRGYEERETHREIVRTRREGGSGRSHRGHRFGRHLHSEGRKMGRMMHRTWRDRQMDA